MQIHDYPSFTNAIAKGDAGPDAAFAALCELTQNLVGAKLFTVMTHDGKTGLARRAFSNMPDVYPVSGTKPMNETDWSRHIFDEKQTFVANDYEGIAAVFFDHELIRSLGCESVINVPIILGGEVLGTINCLHEAGFYTPEKVKTAEALKLPGLACFLLHRLNGQDKG